MASGAVDIASDVAHRPGYIGAEGAIFAIVTMPRACTKPGVVVCPPIHIEEAKNRRREAALAAVLSAAGCPVVRLQYRGTGNSFGDPDKFTVDEAVADAVVASAHLASVAGTPVGCFIGTRVGALVAAAANAEVGHASLVLWAPLLQGSDYLRHLGRAEAISRLNGGLPPVGRTIQERLTDAGSVDVMGYEVTTSLQTSLESSDLEDVVAARDVLLVQFSRTARLENALDSTSARLRQKGVAVTTRVWEEEIAWSLADGGAGPVHGTGDVGILHITRDWIESVA